MAWTQWAWLVGLVLLGIVAVRGVVRLRWRTAFVAVGALLMAIAAGLYYPLRAQGGQALVSAMFATATFLVLLGGMLAFRSRGSDQPQGTWSRQRPGTTKPSWWRGRRG